MHVSFGQVDGKDWETFCQKVLHIKYSDYQTVPAQFGGDLGIEGFTRTGIVFQCYCPDEDPSGIELYEKQRDKITRDINKLLKNAAKISLLGAGTISEWNFLTPRYNSRELLDHCRVKEQLVIGNSSQYFTPSFKIFIRTEDDYSIERQRLIGVGLGHIHSSVDELEQAEVDSFIATNSLALRIKQKFEKLPLSIENINKLTQSSIRNYILGRQELEELNQKFPDVFQAISRLKASKENQLELCLLASVNNPGAVLNEVLKEYEAQLRTSFIGILDAALISRLASESISDWLARCPLDFPLAGGRSNVS